MQDAAERSAGFGLYVHWPFCLAKCPYCDFNSHVARHVDQSTYGDALVRQIELQADRTGDEILTSIYFGGGTPSLMEPATVAAVIDAARSTWRLANAVEITLEANPTSVEADNFRGYRAAGVNRVSLGLQALDDADLRRLGRQHSVDEALRALEIAQSTFDRVSFDLIYARQHQTADAWAKELDRALSFGTSHLSLYQLTVEDGTPFRQRHDRGLLRGLPDEDLSVDLFEMTQAATEAAGLPAYEVSNHAAPGEESRHNLTYWRAGTWVGVGPGAHGRLPGRPRIATQTERVPDAWLASVARDGGLAEEPMTDMEAAEEYMMMSLRLREGSSLSRYKALGGGPLPRLASMVEDGLLVTDGDTLRTTANGRLLLNSVLRDLLSQ